jgi:signal transduction histidine kinase
MSERNELGSSSDVMSFHARFDADAPMIAGALERDCDCGIQSRATVPQQELIAMVAHELRNPLATMSSWLTLWRTGGDSVSASRVEDVLSRQLRKALRLVDDLMNASRTSGHVVAVEEGPVDMLALVTDELEGICLQLRARGQALELELPTDPVLVYGDALRLQRVIANLLDNSSKYTPGGGHISVRLAREADRACVCIRDNGMGISQVDLPRIFEPFFRAKQARGSVPDGLGIGLALARRLVEQYGGTIEARSDGENRGAEFTISLPLAYLSAAGGRVVAGEA